MNSRYTQKLTWLLLILLLCACRGNETEMQPEVLKLAVIAPFSGTFESLGRSTRDGVVLALEEWNRGGGILGRRVEVVLLDSVRNDAGRENVVDYISGRDAARKALDEEGVQFIIGGIFAEASEGIAQVVMEQGAFQISPATVDPDLTLDNEGRTRSRVFLTGFTDIAQGTAMAKFALENLNAEKVALIIAEENTYSTMLANAFETAFTGDGGEVVARGSYDPAGDTFFDMLDEVRDAAPDVIYLPGYYTVANRMVDQARSFGINAIFLGSDGWDDANLDLDAVQGSYFVTHYFSEDPRFEVQLWIRKFQNRYIVPPDTLATIGYDATYILLSAIQQSGSLDPAAVADTLETMDFTLISGSLRYDEYHHPLKSIPILKVQGGQVVYVTAVEPSQP
ncbi:MAG: ABC transporter substrate-binding protein [Anaerolineae bacterium]|nr:ABC transporter substrate-binding protein [Anaerolineae bacterium]